MTDTSTKGRSLLVFPPTGQFLHVLLTSQVKGSTVHQGYYNMLLIISILQSIIYTHLQNVLPKSAHVEFHFCFVVRNVSFPGAIVCSRRIFQGLKWNSSVEIVLFLIRSQASLSWCRPRPSGTPPISPGLPAKSATG